MSEPEWVDLADAPLIADVEWLHAHANGGPPETDSWTPQNLAELADTPPVQPTLGGLQLCYPGKRHVFSGPQESAKTLAAYVIGLSVVRAGSSVVLIDFEMGPWDAKTRLRELGATDDELGGFLYVEPESPAVPASTERLVGLEPSLVIVDAAAGAFQLESFDDNARRDVERWAARWVTPFWKAGIATIVLDHVVKNAEMRGNYAIGSERKVGGADVHLGFEVVHPIKRGGTGLYKIVTHKDRGGYLKRGKLAEFELDSDPETNAITWAFKATVEGDDEHPFRPTVKMEQASRWLERQMEENVPMSHIETGVGGKRDLARLAIQIMVDEGYLTERPGPRKARLMTLLRPYREEYDDLSPTSPDLSPLDIETTSPVDSAPRGAGLRGEVSRRRGEVTSPLPDDGIPF
jgi:hypothetical protein